MSGDALRDLVEAKADVNQRTHYGWTPLLTATQNRHYKLAAYLLEHGADYCIGGEMPRLQDGRRTLLLEKQNGRSLPCGRSPARSYS